MNTALFIAKRYLISKKSHNIINIISAISFFGILFSAMSLIIVLSVFNGFEKLIVGYFNSFNSDFQISASHGKVFDETTFPFDKVNQINGVSASSKVLEDIAMVSYDEKQFLAKLKGVDPNYGINNRFDTLIIDGQFLLQKGEINYMSMGAGVAYHLGVNLAEYKSIKTYYPKRTSASLTNPMNAFNTNVIIPSGVFSAQTDYDAEYVLVPLQYAQELMNYPNEISAVEVFTHPKSNSKKIQKNLQNLLGEKFIVKNRFQQEEMLFKVMQSEKVAIYAILTFILILAMFNIVGTLAMLILDKKEDIQILFHMGATKSTVKSIFMWEGFLLNFSGGFIGLAVGAFLCWLQQFYGIIKIGSENAAYIMNVYPVHMKMSDFLIVLGTVIILGVLSTIIPVNKLAKRLYLNSDKSQS